MSEGNNAYKPNEGVQLTDYLPTTQAAMIEADVVHLFTGNRYPETIKEWRTYNNLLGLQPGGIAVTSHEAFVRLLKTFKAVYHPND